jgi:hypothetical protein
VLCFCATPTCAQLKIVFSASYALNSLWKPQRPSPSVQIQSAALEKFGLGQLFVFPISDPLEWGLPEHAKQKVVWLCPGCCEHLQIRLNRRKHNVQLVRRRAPADRAA